MGMLILGVWKAWKQLWKHPSNILLKFLTFSVENTERSGFPNTMKLVDYVVLNASFGELPFGILGGAQVETALTLRFDRERCDKLVYTFIDDVCILFVYI